MLLPRVSGKSLLFSCLKAETAETYIGYLMQLWTGMMYLNLLGQHYSNTSTYVTVGTVHLTNRDLGFGMPVYRKLAVGDAIEPINATCKLIF